MTYTWSGTNSFTNIGSFTQPPQSVTPMVGADVSPKGYVDSMAGQYGGGLNLFMNYSTTSTVSTDYKTLSKTVSSASSGKCSVIP